VRKLKKVTKFLCLKNQIAGKYLMYKIRRKSKDVNHPIANEI